MSTVICGLKTNLKEREQTRHAYEFDGILFCKVKTFSSQFTPQIISLSYVHKNLSLLYRTQKCVYSCATYTLNCEFQNCLIIIYTFQKLKAQCNVYIEIDTPVVYLEISGQFTHIDKSVLYRWMCKYGYYFNV